MTVDDPLSWNNDFELACDTRPKNMISCRSVAHEINSKSWQNVLDIG